MSQDGSLEGPAQPAYAHQSNPATMMPGSMDYHPQTPISWPATDHQTMDNQGADSEMMAGSGRIQEQSQQILHLTDYINDLKPIVKSMLKT